MQPTKGGDVGRENGTIRIAQIVQRVGGGQAQAHLTQRGRHIVQDCEQGLPRVRRKDCEPRRVGTLSPEE